MHMMLSMVGHCAVITCQAETTVVWHGSVKRFLLTTLATPIEARTNVDAPVCLHFDKVLLWFYLLERCPGASRRPSIILAYLIPVENDDIHTT